MSVLVLAFLVAAVVTTGGGGGGLLGLEVLGSPVAVLCVLLTRLVLLVLEVWGCVTFGSAAWFTCKSHTEVYNTTVYDQPFLISNCTVACRNHLHYTYTDMLCVMTTCNNS